MYEKFNDRWEIGVALSPDGKFNQISFVNGICTTQGGRHVEYISGQVVKKIVEIIPEEKRRKWLRTHT